MRVVAIRRDGDSRPAIRTPHGGCPVLLCRQLRHDHVRAVTVWVEQRAVCALRLGVDPRLTQQRGKQHALYALSDSSRGQCCSKCACCPCGASLVCTSRDHLTRAEGAQHAHNAACSHPQAWQLWRLQMMSWRRLAPWARWQQQPGAQAAVRTSMPADTPVPAPAAAACMRSHHWSQ